MPPIGYGASAGAGRWRRFLAQAAFIRPFSSQCHFIIVIHAACRPAATTTLRCFAKKGERARLVIRLCERLAKGFAKGSATQAGFAPKPQN